MVLVFALFLMLVSGLLVYIIPALQAQIVNFVANVPGYLDWLQHTALPRIQELLGVDLALDMASLRQTVLSHWREVGDWASNLFLYITRSGLSVIGWVVNLLLIPVVTFYLLLDWNRLLAHSLALVPPRGRRGWQPGARNRRGTRKFRVPADGHDVAHRFPSGSRLQDWISPPIGVLAGLAVLSSYAGFISGLIAAPSRRICTYDWLPLLWWPVFSHRVLKVCGLRRAGGTVSACNRSR